MYNSWVRDRMNRVNRSSCKSYKKFARLKICVMILLHSFICIGMFVSYLPQYLLIYSLGNSLGFSPNFFLLGSIGVVSTLSNLVILQFYILSNCFQNSKGFECIESLFGILEISIQLLCFNFLFFLFIHFFPRSGTSEDFRTTFDEIQTERESQESQMQHLENDQIHSLDALWQQTKRNAIFSILYLLLSITIVIISLFSSTKIMNLVALSFGLFSSICGILQFFPQLVYTIYSREIGSLSIGTMSLQVPGSFLLVFSLSSTPGANWTSYISYLISGLLQANLLMICVYFRMFDSVRNNSQGEEEDEVLLGNGSQEIQEE